MRSLFSMTIMLSYSTKWNVSTDGSADSTTHIGCSRRASAAILRSKAFYTACYHADPISMYDLDVSLHVELVNLTGTYDGQAIFEVGNNNSL
jgi:hypothetical protein